MSTSAGSTQKQSRLADLQGALALLPARGKRRAKKSLGGELASDNLAAYQHAAHWIPRAIDPFVDLTTAFTAGLGLEDENGPEDDSQLVQAMSPEDRENHIRVYMACIDLVRGFRALMDEFHEDISGFAKLVQVMDDHARQARSDDTKSLRYEAIQYLLTDTTQSLDPRIATASNSPKRDRGYTHFVTARLLCPARLLMDFDLDPKKFCDDVGAGRITITAADWPAFLYDNEANSYSADEIDKGLLRGHFLLRVYRHIFRGPACALDPFSSKGKGGNAKLHGLTQATPRTIAYAAVQARFVLTTRDSWDTITDDDEVDAVELYENIVKLFTMDPTSQWAIETLDWFTQQVFPNKSTKRKRIPEDTSRAQPKPSDVDLLMEQRRRAAETRLSSQPVSLGVVAASSSTVAGTSSTAPTTPQSSIPFRFHGCS